MSIHSAYQSFPDISAVPTTLKLLVDRLELEYEGVVRCSVKRAVFDLDNTLLVGDIGEAVFAYLLSGGHPLGMRWSDYERLRGVNPDGAYAAVVEAMRGMSVSDLVTATVRVMAMPERHIDAEGVSVPVPAPHPVMRGLVHLLHRKGYAVYVITASNQVSARMVCSEWFGIPEERVFGIRQELDGEKLTSSLLQPLPIGQGKAEVYRTYIGSDRPRITASDSTRDIPLLDLTEDGGVALWLGKVERREIIDMHVAPTVTTYAVFPSSRFTLTTPALASG